MTRKLTLNDASILALLAQHQKVPASKRRKLQGMLGAEGKKVAQFLFAKGTGKKTNPAAATAAGLKQWATGNARVRFKPARANKAGVISYRVILRDKQGANVILGSPGSGKSTRRKSR